MTLTPERIADDKLPLKCPHCDGVLNVEMVASLANESRMSFEITSAPGELLKATTIGGVLSQLDKALTSLGKDIGVQTVVLVEDVAKVGDTVKVNLLLTRFTKDAK